METKLYTALENQYGYKQFRPGQKEIISDACDGENVLGVLPTGSGKSICYQLPAKILPGVVVVVSPLISLMIDQVKRLKATGFKQVIAFNSFMSFQEKNRALAAIHEYKLIYISPEMLQQQKFLDTLKSTFVSLFVVDEAHCISQWGHEFRPDYLKMASVIKHLQSPPVMALSATATPEVQEDIIKQLNLQEVKKHIYPMDRPNIALVVEQLSDNEAKVNFLTKRLANYPGPTMIYFSSREWTEKAVRELRFRLPNLNIAFYHGGMEQADRILIQQQFTNGQLDVICCTSAFGMGIDKPDIRLVVHFHLPSRIESFIQEIGRAGRDQFQSVSIVLIAPNDDFIPRRIIESELPEIDKIEMVIKEIQKLQQRKGLPIKEDILLEQLQISEVQWRFINYHIERLNLLDTSTTEDWQQAVNEIKNTIIYRNRYKHRKLSEMLIWSAGKECRRNSLFTAFQDTVKQPEKICCDICGFKQEDWKPAVQHQPKLTQDWKTEFDKIMLRELIYENES